VCHFESENFRFSNVYSSDCSIIYHLYANMDRDRFLETCRDVFNSITRILETNRSLEVINSSLTRLDALARNVNRMTTSYPEFTPTRQFQGSDCKRRNSLPMSEILCGQIHLFRVLKIFIFNSGVFGSND